MIKRIFQVFLLLCTLIALLWGVVVWVVATPEIITPKVVEIAQRYVRSEVSIKSVDLSLLSKFPNVTLRVDSLRITQTKDSIDDLVFAEHCQISISPLALLNKEISVSNISLHNASVYLYVDSLNGPLKTFILPEVDEADTLNSFDLSQYKLSLKRFMIDSTRIVIDDRVSKFYTRVENFGTDTSMDISSVVSDLDVETGFSNLIVWHKGEVLVKRTSMDLKSLLHVDRDSMQIRFDDAKLRVNDINLTAHGVLNRDTVANGIMVDVTSALTTPSLSEFMALIPTSIISEKEKITTEGAVNFDMKINGLYSETSKPTVGMTLKVDDGRAKYESRKLSLEDVNCDAYMFVDFNSPKNSYADVKRLHINTSDILNLDFSGKIDDLLRNPMVDMRMKSDIDFDRFSELFPLNESIILSGTNKSDLTLDFSLNEMQKNNYANLYIDGVSDFNNVEVSVDASKFMQDTTQLAYLYLQADKGHMLFGDRMLAESNSRTLRAQINLKGMDYKTKSGEYLSIEDVELTLGANFDRKSSGINGVGGRGIAKRTVVGVDSLFSAALESSDITLIITPKNETRPSVFKGIINSQQISATEPTFDTDIELSSVDMSVAFTKNGDHWDMDGTVGFADLEMFTALFPLPISVPATSVTVGNKVINLQNADLKLGSSRMVATGHLNNLLRKMLIDPKAELSGELRVDASYFDFNEFMEASNKSVLMAEADSLAVDSLAVDSLAVDSLPTESSIFIVPNKVDFKFDISADSAKFEKATITNLSARAAVKGGVLSLDDVKLNAIGADATGSMLYRNLNRHSVNMDADMAIVGIEIGRIGELFPSVETMFPMLKSFEGDADFDMRANTNFNSQSEIEIPTLYSAMRIKGKDLVLMDSETFADLSKTLKFKNRDRNVIDSLETFVLVDGAKVDVLPFAMSIDRYSAIIGGSQVIDPVTYGVDYSYHISIMKSPLPFKAGVDVTGNLDDFKFRVKSAKLKKTNFDEQRAIYEGYRKSIDVLATNIEQDIEEHRRKIQERRRAQREKQEQEEQQAAAAEEAVATTDEESVEEPEAEYEVVEPVAESAADSLK